MGEILGMEPKEVLKAEARQVSGDIKKRVDQLLTQVLEDNPNDPNNDVRQKRTMARLRNILKNANEEAVYHNDFDGAEI